MFWPIYIKMFWHLAFSASKSTLFGSPVLIDPSPSVCGGRPTSFKNWTSWNDF